jgi:hypothetical protein
MKRWNKNLILIKSLWKDGNVELFYEYGWF